MNITPKPDSTQDNPTSFKWNMASWLIYFAIAMICLSPFFPNANDYHDVMRLIGLSLIVGFFAGLLNRIAQELVIIQKLLIKKYENI